MKTTTKQTPKQLSLALDHSIRAAVIDIADTENLSMTVMLRKLVVIGLKHYGVEVRGNQVVAA